MSLTSSSFRSTNRINTVVPLTEVINFFEFPAGTVSEIESSKARAAIALSFIKSKAADERPDTPSNTVAYVISVSNLLFPDMLRALKAKNAGKFKAHTSKVTLEDIAKHFKGRADDDSTEPVPDFELEQHNTSISLDDWNAGIEIVGARWGVEMFPIGKNVSSDNLAGFRQNRIDALKNYYKLGDEVNAALDEPALPSLSSLIAIERMFSTFKAVRKAFAEYWIDAINKGATTRQADGFLITFRLTDGFGLGAPQFISDLIFSHPKIRDFPELKANIEAFQQAAGTYARENFDHRGFTKVLYGSNHRLFSNTTRGALLALAVAFKSLSDPSAARFMDIGSFTGTISRANAYLVKNGFDPITTSDGMTQDSADIEEA